MIKTFVLLSMIIVQNSSNAQFISGKTSGLPKSYIAVQHFYKYSLGLESDTIRLLKNGSFSYFRNTTEHYTKSVIEIVPGQFNNIWVAKGEKLILTIDNPSSTPTFFGTLARINQYIQKEDQFYASIYKVYEQKHPDLNILADSRSDYYFHIHDSVTADCISMLEKSIKNPINKWERIFIEERKKELIFRNLFYKISYDDPPLEKLIFYQKHFKVASPVSYKYSDKIDFNNPKLLNNASFLKFSRMFFMELVFRYKNKENLKLSRDKFYEKMFFFINQLSTNKLCNGALKASFISGEINTMVLGENSYDTTYRRFVDSLLSYSLLTKEARYIEKLYNLKIDALYSLKKGTFAPNCVLVDTNGKSITLESLKGRLLYIDVWASWCGKCLEEMPYWNKLAFQYKDDPNIAFITISTDKIEDKEKWMRLLHKFKTQGHHFLSVGGVDSEFAKKFFINSYPTNILINKDGKIITMHAERPSTINLSDYLKNP